MKIIFLHIPKTAGQSVHAALVDAFGNEAVCPARVNHQLKKMSITEINRYKVFSGHFDWSLLDCIKGPKYVFTVLREPIDRILSFYFYTRGEALKLTPEQLARADHVGQKAAIELSPVDFFFSSENISFRRHIDNLYDNFYTYYFAARRYDSRGEMLNFINQGQLSCQDLKIMAKDNLLLLNDVFTVNNISCVFSVIASLSNKEIIYDGKNRINVNTNLASDDRLSEFQALGADAATINLLQEYCSLDNELWNLFSER